MTDELLNLSPTITGPQEVAAGNPNRPSDADLRPLEPLPQAPQSRYPATAYPGPMNPEDNRRLSVYPHIEVEPTADVCPSGPSRDAVDQGRDGRVIWAGSRSEPARQGRGRGRSFDSGHPMKPCSSTRKLNRLVAVSMNDGRFPTCKNRTRPPDPGRSLLAPVFLTGDRSLRMGAGSRLAKPSRSDARRAAAVKLSPGSISCSARPAAWQPTASRTLRLLRLLSLLLSSRLIPGIPGAHSGFDLGGATWT